MRAPGRRRLEESTLTFCFVNVCCEDGRNRAHDLVLNGKYVLKLSIVPLGPTLNAGQSIHKLRSDTNTVTTTTNTPFQHVAHAELAPDMPDVYGLASVLEAGVTGDDKQLREPRQLCDDVVRDAVGEIVLLRVATHIREWKHGDRRLVREGEGGSMGPLVQL